MKVNHFTVIPASVRYDRMLSDKSILLWGEISASADQYGVSADDNLHLANILNVDVRTIIRCMGQLVDNGHIVKFVEGGKRKLKVIIRSIEMPKNEAVIVPEPDNMGPTIEFTNRLLGIWEQNFDMTITDKSTFYGVIHKLRKALSEEEILRGCHNRIAFIRESQLLWLINVTPQFFEFNNFVSWITIKH